MELKMTFSEKMAETKKNVKDAVISPEYKAQMITYLERVEELTNDLLKGFYEHVRPDIAPDDLRMAQSNAIKYVKDELVPLQSGCFGGKDDKLPIDVKNFFDEQFVNLVSNLDLLFQATPGEMKVTDISDEPERENEDEKGLGLKH
jgi:hypothetical protein